MRATPLPRKRRRRPRPSSPKSSKAPACRCDGPFVSAATTALVEWWRARVRAESEAGREYAAGDSQPSQSPSQSIDWIGWRSFLLAMLALAIALVLALYSSSSAHAGENLLGAKLGLGGPR